MTCPLFEQDPLDKRIVNIDFSSWLGSTTTIASASWTVPSGLTESNSSETSTVCTNYFSGGTDGAEYEVAVTITTDDAVARDKTQRMIIRVAADC